MTTDAGTRTGLRQLTNDDLASVVRLLMRQPVHNVFVSSRVRHLGLDPYVLGCPVWGYWRDAELVALCHAGSNLVPVGAGDPEVVAAFAEEAGHVRRCSSISGDATVALDLWRALVDRWGDAWSRPREVRAEQPLMLIDDEPELPGDPRVETVTEGHYDAYFAAAVAMYTEEVGVSPLDPSPSAYRSYVRTLINSARAFGVIDGGQVLFKSDLGSVSGSHCQVQGVWLEPSLRGQGMAAPLMSSVVRLARRISPHVSLYVNSYNTRAIRTYERVGFRRVGTLATVLY